MPVRIETVESLSDAGERVADPKRVVNQVAERKARQWGRKGVFILLSEQEHVISNVLVHSSLANRLDEPRRRAIRDAFIGPFREKRFNDGLLAGVAALEEALKSSRARGGAAGSPLPGRPW